MSIQQLFFSSAAADKIVATGGTIYTNGDYKAHVFTSSGTFTVNQINDGTVSLRYALCGGGTGGGFNGSPPEYQYFPGGSGGDGVMGGDYRYIETAVQFNSIFSTTGDYSITVASAGTPNGSTIANSGPNINSDLYTGGAGGGAGGGGEGIGGSGGTGAPGGGDYRFYWFPSELGYYSDFGGGGNGGGGGASYEDGIPASGGTGGSNAGGSGGSGGDSPNGNGNNASTNSVTTSVFGYGGSGGGGGSGNQGNYPDGGTGSAAQSGGVVIVYRYK